MVINGKENHYTYNDLEKVVQVVKNAKTISGQITYKIAIKNVGEKTGKLSMLKDIVEDGLKFDSKKNTGWVEKEGNIYYEPINNVSIKKGEKREISLVLDIKETNEIKTYINQIDADGETYERVVYILNGEKYREENVILGEKIERIEIDDDSFDGWYTDKNYTNKYNYKNEVTKDLILYGRTEIIKHKVEFYDKDPETNIETKWDEQEIKEGNKAIEPEEPEHRGYTFECWMDEHDNIWNFNNPVERDIKLTSCYTINKYTVLFIDGDEEYNRQSIEYKGNITVPTNPTKQYYTFNYWHLEGNNNAYDLTTPVVEDVTLYSKYIRNKHTITFIDKHPSTDEEVDRIETEVNEGDKVTKPTDPTKSGYDFDCWTKSNGECYDFTKPVLEDEVLESKYSVILYTITYKGLTNEEKESLNNPGTYTIEDEIELNNPNNRLDNDGDLSEIFIGWTGSNGNDASTSVSIPKGSTGSKTFTANFIEADPDVYPITYELKNGTLGEGLSNPSSYTKKTNTFTLNNPSKKGYTFDGWSGTDLTGNANTTVTITKGSRGARSFEAWYTPKDYTIEYENNCGEVSNPTSYTIESDTFTLNNPSKTGYEFTGWKIEGSDEKYNSITIEKGSTGNRKYIATCSPIKYTITYHLEDGELEEGKTNPDEYTIESDDITLNNPSKDHYTFAGWTGTGLENITNPVVIPHGSIGNREYTANYEVITHHVVFKDKDPENPTPETTSDFGDPKTVNDGDKVTPPETNPEHTGYTCDKWSTKIDGNYNDDAYDFTSEVLNDITLYTLCKKNSYKVTYMDGENQYASENVLYKEKTTKPLTDPNHKSEHKIFLGWTLNDELFDFNTLVTENLTLHASYEVVEAPVISHTPTDWTNQDVNVTVTNAGTAEKDYTGYTYKYKINDGEYQNYETVFAQGENCDVYAVAYKLGVSSEEVKHEITNIDKIKPTITSLTADSITKTGFVISISGYDHESGLKEYKIYNGDQYVTTISFDGETTSQTKTYTFSELEQGTVYTIKVIAHDKATNSSETEELEVETTQDERIVAQIIEFDNTELDEYIPLSSIHQGLTWDDGVVNCGTTHQCTIQMLDDVTESNDVLEGQNITLDLNGYTINGKTAYTFTNEGDFKVIDSKPYVGEDSELMVDYIKNLESTNSSLITDSTTDANIRYVGSNPDNYISFNGELWRIIGVMNNVYASDESSAESRLKIVRAESIGQYSWDSSSSSSNRGYGINEWSQADLMKLLNPGYEEENIGGSLYYNSTSGSCYTSYSNRSSACDFSESGLSSSAKNMIDPAIWYTGSNGRTTSTSYYTAKNMYNYEKGASNGKICSSGYYCTDTVARTTTWNGYVGIISPSDYGFATSTSSCTGSMSSFSTTCYNNDWLNYNQWTITPQGNTSYATKVFNISSSRLGSYDASSLLPVYPVVYLKSNLLYKSGTGTSTDPYVLMTDAEYQAINSTRVNGIKNSTDTAIINNGKFTLGNIEETNDVVSETKPYIEGANKGVLNNNIFNFYDGKIKGVSAISGNVTDTPFPYNATIYDISEDNLNKQLAVLKIVTDPEARIGNVYYSKTQKALDDASKGYLQDIFSQATFRDSLLPVDKNTNSFVYDADNDWYTNNGLAAKSYMYIDLTDYTENQELSIKTNLADYGGANIYVKKNNADGKVLNSSYLSSGENIYKFVLEKGQRYYILFEQSYNNNLTISDITLSDYTIKEYDSKSIDLETEVLNYSFDYDEETKSYKSNNQYVLNSVAFANTEIDLTSSETDKMLLVSAYLETYGSSDIGIVRISETNDYNDNDYNSLLYMKGKSDIYNKVGPYIADVKLTKGKKYYLQFYYKKTSYGKTESEYISNNCKDQFTINNIRLIDNVLTDDLNNYYSSGTKIDLSTELKSEDEYGFTGTSYAPSNAGISDTIAHSYIKVDLTNETKPKYLKFDVSGYVNFELATTESKDLPTGSYKSFINNPSGTYINTYYQYYYANLTPGKVNYVHLISRGSSQTSFSLSDVQIFDGEMIDLNTLKKVQAKGFGLNTSSSYTGMYTPLSINSGETADGYVKIDLTDKAEDQLITANLYVKSGYNSKYLYITSNEKNILYSKLLNKNRNDSLFFVDFQNGGSYIYNTGGRNKVNDLYNYSFILPKGNIYYLHFGTYGNESTTNYYDNQLLIKSVKCQPVNVDQDYKIGAIIVNQGTEVDGQKDFIFDETDDENFRFIGKSPNNYISFNDELWRIIGVFDTEDENGNKDRRIKITRDESFSGLSFDSTPYVDGPPINGGLGINEWSQSDLMKLLNPGFENNKEELFKYDNTYISQGIQSVNNSLYWNKGSGLCINNVYNQSNNCDFTSTGLSDSAKEFIDTVKWNTGAIPYNNNISALSIYNYERGNKTVMSDSWATAGIDDDVERQTEWVGKVGLPYISDYILATGDGYSNGSVSMTRDACINAANTSYGACTSTNDWMANNSSPMTFISSVFGPSSSGSSSYLYSVPYAAVVYGGTYPAAIINMQVKPTVYLSTKTIISSGTGTNSDPYRITLGTSKNNKNNYGLDETQESGDEQEYHEEIIIDNDLVKSAKIYGFTLDDETDEFVNENSKEVNSIASSYFVLDLTNSDRDKEITFNYSISSDSYNYGYIDILKDVYKKIDYSQDYRDSNVVRTSGTTTSSYKAILSKGSKYYIQFGFYKKVSSTTSDEFRIKINYREDFESNETFTRFDGIVPILNEEPDTVHLLKDVAVKVPLKIDKTQKVILDLEGYTLSSSSSDINSTIINNDGDLTIVDTIQEGSNSHTGNITGRRLINNNEGASLDIKEAILNASYMAILNNGTMIMDDNGIINITSTSSIGYGISNGETGVILDGTGTINGGTISSDVYYNTDSRIINIYGFYSIYNQSKIDTGISGYNFVGGLINNASDKEYTINNIKNLTGGVFASHSNTIIKNSSFKNVGSIYSNIEFNKTNVSNHFYGMYGTNTKIVDSTMKLYTGEYTGNIDIEESNINKVSLGGNVSYQSRPSNPTVVIKSSTVDTVSGSLNKISIIGDSEVNQVTLKFGEVVLGEKDSTVSTTYPKIGTNKGTKIKAENLYFYDGIVTGTKNEIINAHVVDVEDNYEIVGTENGTLESIYLDKVKVAKIGNKEYSSLKDAVEAAQESEEEVLIEVIHNIYNTKDIVIPSTKTITIDYNGYKVTGYNENFVTNNGVLKITDSSGSPIYSKYTGNLVQNNGRLVLESINTNGIINNDMNMYVFSGEYDSVINNKNLNITGGSFNGANKTRPCINAAEGAVTYIYNGTFNYYIYNSGTLNVSGGSFTDFGYYNFITTETGTTTIDSIPIQTNRFTLDNKGTMNINKSKFTMNGSSNAGTLKITDCTGTITGTINNSGTFVINNSSLEGNISYNPGIFSSGTNGSSLEVDNSTIINNSSTAIRVGSTNTSNNTFSINSGTITGKGIALEDNGNSTITIGKKDGVVTEENPKITGTTNGIKSNNTTSTINFYDGTITGSTNNAISSIISDIEVDSDIVTINNGDGTESKYLSTGSLIKNVTKNIEYTSVQKAINAASSGDELELLRDYNTTGSFLSLEIGSDKNITFDINGHSISYSGLNGDMFINNGTLHFINSKSTGIIANNTENSIFKNNGTLVIDDVTESIKYESYFVDNSSTGTATINNSNFTLQKKKLINNDGIMYLNNITYSSDSEDSYNPIINSGTLTIDCGSYSFTNNSSFARSKRNLIENTGTINLNETITDKSLNMTGYRITNNDNGIINVNAGNIYSEYIDLNGSSSFNVKGGNIRSINITLNDTANLNVTGGKIEQILGYLLYCVYSESSSTTITIGEKDGNIDNTSPLLLGASDQAVINTLGSLKLYNGSIIGGPQPVMTSSLEIEDDSSIIIEPKQYVIETYEAIGYSEHLITGDVIKNVNTGVSYLNIKEAVDEAENNHTLKLLQNGVITSSISIPTTKTITIDLDGNSISSSVPRGFNNSGKLKIINGNAGQKSTMFAETEPFIRNDGELEIDGDIDINASIVNNLNHKFTLKNGTINKYLDNSGEFVMDGGIIKNYDTVYKAQKAKEHIVTNTGTITINGGSLLVKKSDLFTNEYKSNGSKNLIMNSGTITINDVTSTNTSEYPVITMKEYNSKIIIEDCNYTGSVGFANYSNKGTVTVNGGTYSVESGYIFNAEIINIYGGNFSTTNNAAIGRGQLNIENVTINGISLGNMIGGTINNVTATFDGVLLYTGSGTIKGNTTLTSTNDTCINNGGTLNIMGNASIISETEAGITNTGTIVLGVNDNNVSVASPSVKGLTYGISTSNDSSLKFYDGMISGKTSPYGVTSLQTAPDYIVKVTTENDYKNATLILDSDVEKVASYNNINYPSLQSAINSCPTDGTNCDITIYTNITLNQQLTIPDGAVARVYLNGFTITPEEYVTNHEGTGSIELISGTPSGVGGAIYRFLANITGEEINARDIIIYQMEDGTALLPENTYKLYKLIDNDYKLVKVNEKEIGNYDLGNDNANIRTTTGQIKVHNIGEGNYKLVGSDGKELDFEISENNVSSNIRVDRYSSKANVTATAIATLILQLQTGVLRTPYILIIILILVLISVSYLLIQKRKKDYE